MTLTLRTTVDIETDNAADTVAAIDDALTETDYRLSVTPDMVRLYARVEADNDALTQQTDTMVAELNSLSGVDITAEGVMVSGNGD